MSKKLIYNRVKNKRFSFSCFHDIQNMINFDDYTNQNKTERNSNWPYIPDHPYRVLIIRGYEDQEKKYIIKFNIQSTRY